MALNVWDPKIVWRNQCSTADSQHGNLPPPVHLTFDRWKISKNKMWNQMPTSDDFTTQRFPVFPPVMVCPKCRVPTFYFHKCTIVSKSYIIEIDEMNFHFIASFSTVKKHWRAWLDAKNPRKLPNRILIAHFFAGPISLCVLFIISCEREFPFLSHFCPTTSLNEVENRLEYKMI